MQDNNWREYANKRRLPVETGRNMIPLAKHPQDLDFSTTIGGTTYVVNSHFNKNANDSLLTIISRLHSEGKNLSE